MAYTPGGSAVRRDTPDTKPAAVRHNTAPSSRRLLSMESRIGVPFGLRASGFGLTGGHAPPLRSLRESLVQSQVLVVEAHDTAVDDHVRDCRADLERIAFRDDHVRHLAGVERTNLVGHAEDLGGV